MLFFCILLRPSETSETHMDQNFNMFRRFMLLPARSSLIHTDVWRAEGGLLAQFVRSSYMPPLEIMVGVIEPVLVLDAGSFH